MFLTVVQPVLVSYTQCLIQQGCAHRLRLVLDEFPLVPVPVSPFVPLSGCFLWVSPSHTPPPYTGSELEGEERGSSGGGVYFIHPPQLRHPLPPDDQFSSGLLLPCRVSRETRNQTLHYLTWWSRHASVLIKDEPLSIFIP